MRCSILALAIVGVAALISQAPADDVAQVPDFDQFIVIPLRIHIPTSKDFDLANAEITDAEIARTVARMNAIWAKAGIAFGLESIVHEPVVQFERFKAMVEDAEGPNDKASLLAYLLPVSSRVFDGAHVYIFRELPLNSVYLFGPDITIVREKPQLVEVKGGGDHPLARVASRGLGSSLGLHAREDHGGLMSSGTNGIGLGEEEVARVRKVAQTVPGAIGAADVFRAAEAATKVGKIDRARQLWGWISEIPEGGPKAAEAKKRLKALPVGKS